MLDQRGRERALGVVGHADGPDIISERAEMPCSSLTWLRPLALGITCQLSARAHGIESKQIAVKTTGYVFIALNDSPKEKGVRHAAGWKAWFSNGSVTREEDEFPPGIPGG
jgi:hypothetical protein